MPILEISDTEKTGEVRWGITLKDDVGAAILRNGTPLAQGTANSTAKTLIHKGADSPTLEKEPEEKNVPAWFFVKADDRWLAHFTLVPETSFVLLLKPEDTQGDPKSAELALDDVKGNLRKAEIKWVPPEADPAYEDKAAALTPTVGHPGS
ncbi:MAG: hypothetical protein OXC05_11705 [Halieaceae bacterium]|nr:hypothetical protein [Halieaceae bacterium]